MKEYAKECVDALMDYGVDLEIADINGYTAEAWAEWHKDDE